MYLLNNNYQSQQLKGTCQKQMKYSHGFKKPENVCKKSNFYLFPRECRILWRDYHNSVRLIVVVPLDSVSDFHIHRLLDNIFQVRVKLTKLA